MNETMICPQMKRMIFLFALLIAGLCYPTTLRAQSDYHSIHDLILKHQFSKAERHLKTANLTKAEDLYLSHLITFLEINLTGDKAKLDAFKELSSDRLGQIKKQRGRQARFAHAAILLESSVTRARFGDYMAAALHFNKGYQIINDLNQEYPDYKPAKMMHGLMLILFGSIPDEYNWVLKLMSIEGDVDYGLYLLQQVFSNNLNSDDCQLLEESLIFLTFSYRNFNPDPLHLKNLQAYYHIPAIDSLVSSSPMMRYSLVALLKDLGKNDLAISYLSREYPQKPEIPFYYLDYYQKGLCLLQKMDFRAEWYFSIYLSEYPGDIYKKAAAQKIAWVKLLQGNKEEYKKYMQKVNAFEESVSGADEAAQKEFSRNEFPNVALLKVRLLFDGGYYRDALKELLSHKPSEAYSSEKERLEFTYRLARIYHKLAIYDKAKSYYRMTVESGRDKPFYFGANAALHLGELYLNEGNKAAAKSSFEQCLDMNPDTYKASIHQKAKAYLQQIK